MGKSASDSVLDALLDKVKTATSYTLCSQEPTTRAEAVSTFALLTAGAPQFDANSDDATNGGRKSGVQAQIAQSPSSSGTADHAALCDGTELLYVTVLTSPIALSVGTPVDLDAWEFNSQDPV